MSTKRVGMVIGLDPDRSERYRELHADSCAGVRDLLQKYHLHNFSIFCHRLDDGKEYLFGYFEYTGEDYEADMAKLAEEPRNVAWLEQCDPCQAPLQGEDTWAIMKRVYYNP